MSGIGGPAQKVTQGPPAPNGEPAQPVHEATMLPAILLVFALAGLLILFIIGRRG
jgi:hypothetical protein